MKLILQKEDIDTSRTYTDAFYLSCVNDAIQERIVSLNKQISSFTQTDSLSQIEQTEIIACRNFLWDIEQRIKYAKKEVQ
jgi:hypothetical protein